MTRELFLQPPEPSDDDTVGALCLERHRHFGSDIERDVRDTLGRPSWAGDPGIDRATDVRLAERDGEIVGYAWIRPAGEIARAELWALNVDIDAGLTDWLVRTADQRGVKKLIRTVVADPVAQTVLAARGFEYERSSLRMDRGIEDVGEVRWPEGIAIENELGPDQLLDAVFRIDQASFADNEGFVPMDIADFEATVARDDFRSDLAWFAFGDDGSDAGFCVCSLIPQCGNVGFIEDIGVLPAFRRRGLARALLRHAMHTLIAEGATVIALTTAAWNRRAQGLYFSEGFEITHEYRHWVRATGRSSTAAAR